EEERTELLSRLAELEEISKSKVIEELSVAEKEICLLKEKVSDFTKLEETHQNLVVELQKSMKDCENQCEGLRMDVVVLTNENAKLLEA
ncbi:hypothetical protein HK096_008950, partial [Nowakowskiella sp. JEL0078]